MRTPLACHLIPFLCTRVFFVFQCQASKNDNLKFTFAFQSYYCLTDLQLPLCQAVPAVCGSVIYIIYALRVAVLVVPPDRPHVFTLHRNKSLRMPSNSRAAPQFNYNSIQNRATQEKQTVLQTLASNQTTRKHQTKVNSSI